MESLRELVDICYDKVIPVGVSIFAFIDLASVEKRKAPSGKCMFFRSLIIVVEFMM
jgi:hypothetical protein